MQTDSLQENGTRDAHQQGGRESRGRTGEGGGRSRRGRRSPGKTGSPVGAGSGKSPSPQIDDVATAVAVGLAETPPTRSWSVPGNVSIYTLSGSLWSIYNYIGVSRERCGYNMNYTSVVLVRLHKTSKETVTIVLWDNFVYLM